MKSQSKRIASFALLACMTVGIVGAASWRETITVDVNKVVVVANRKTMTQPSLLWNDTTYIPLRETLEAADCVVEWNQATSTAKVSNRYSALVNILAETNQLQSWAFDASNFTGRFYAYAALYATNNGYSVNVTSLKQDVAAAQERASWLSAMANYGIVEQSHYLTASGYSKILTKYQMLYSNYGNVASKFAILAKQAENLPTFNSSQIDSFVKDIDVLNSLIYDFRSDSSEFIKEVSSYVVLNPELNLMNEIVG